MINSKKILISTIATTALLSGVAFAGDMTDGDIEDTTVTTTVTTEAQAEAATNDTLGELLQSNGEILPQSDEEVLMADGDEKDKDRLIKLESDNEIASNAIVVPTLNAEPITTVSCPVGTTAQPDMTCLITGNFKFDTTS